MGSIAVSLQVGTNIDGNCSNKQFGTNDGAYLFPSAITNTTHCGCAVHGKPIG